ncbi:MAG: hypothetical protein H0W64_10585 [Gammaproteobacteria bacterium]|nr:hypothetical protein [Gammaproteobacteria bacterium]
MMGYQLSELCKYINDDYVLHGNVNEIHVENIATPFTANEKSLVFISPTHADKQKMFNATKANLIICDDSIQFCSKTKKNLLVVQDPKYIFAKIANAFFVEKPASGIHPTAIIHPEAKIAEDVYIGPNVYIGKCEIKKNTMIYGNTYLYDNVYLGEGVVVNAGSVLGAAGCGQIKGKDNIYIPFPHIGRLIIENNVEIGPQTCIARGALGDTIIKENTVIDSQVKVGHNVVIEENVIILANVVIGGSSIIKNNVVLAIGAHICDYITVGEHAHIGPGVIIMSDVAAHAKVVPRLPLTLPK